MRKAITIILLSALGFGGVAQSDGVVFTVLHADSLLKNGIPVVALDQLNKGDVLTSTGLTLLVHKTGAFIAITTDSTLTISTMDALVLERKGMTACHNLWPDLNLLFEEASYNKTGAVTAGIPDIEILLPGQNALAHPKQDIYLVWKPYNQRPVDSVQITLTNLYAEPLGRPVVSADRNLRLPLDTVELDTEDQILIVQLGGAGSRHILMEEVGLELSPYHYLT